MLNGCVKYIITDAANRAPLRCVALVWLVRLTCSHARSWARSLILGLVRPMKPLVILSALLAFCASAFALTGEDAKQTEGRYGKPKRMMAERAAITARSVEFQPNCYDNTPVELQHVYGKSGCSGEKMWLTLVVLVPWQVKQFTPALQRLLEPCW